MTHSQSLLRTLVATSVASLASLGFSQFSFPTFTSANVGAGASQITLNQTTLVNGGLQLTTNGGAGMGSAFYNTKQSVLTDFSTSFRYSSTGGDGLTFLFNDNAAGAGLLGDYGGYLGYIGTSRTLAVEFDNFDNGGGDTVGIAVRAGTDSGFGNSAANGYATTVTGTHDVKITHSTANVLSVYFDNMTVPVLTVPNLSLAPYADASGLSYLGFTAGQATASGDQRILSWNSPAAVPEPSALAALGLGAVAFMKRRRK